MASTGLRRIKGEHYPFGEKDQGDASFSDLFDDNAVAEVAMERESASKEDTERRQMVASVQRYPPPQETLDLHGCTAQEAEDKTQRFVEEAGRRGIRTVRVITGKGLHSPGGKAVLPDVIELRLSLLKREGAIAAFQWDRRVKDRSGALLVYL